MDYSFRILFLILLNLRANSMFVFPFWTPQTNVQPKARNSCFSQNNALERVPTAYNAYLNTP